MRHFRFLLDSVPGDGGDTTPPHAIQPPDTGTQANPSPAAPPPAAKAVLESGAREGDAGELVELKRKLADEARARKEVEMKNAELEDTVHRLKTPPAPRPTKAKDDPSAWTYFG